MEELKLYREIMSDNSIYTCSKVQTSKVVLGYIQTIQNLAISIEGHPIEPILLEQPIEDKAISAIADEPISTENSTEHYSTSTLPPN
jgi:hypothetical protein